MLNSIKMKVIILGLIFTLPLLISLNSYSQNSVTFSESPEYLNTDINSKSPKSIQNYDKMGPIEKTKLLAYTDNPRTLNPLGISLYGFGPAIFLSVSIDYFVSPSLSLEIGGGLFGLYAGTRYHFRGKMEGKTWTTYTGLFYANYGEQIGTEYLFFLPIGRQYTGKNGFSFALEMLILNEGGPVYLPLWPGVRVGYRF